VIIDNVVDGNMAMTYPETLPYVCNMCQLPILGTPGKQWNVKDYPLEYNGRLYHFGSEVDRWVFEALFAISMDFVDVLGFSEENGVCALLSSKTYWPTCPASAPSSLPTYGWLQTVCTSAPMH
jgi:hypothetical protein